MAFFANHGSYAHLFGRFINFIIPIIIQGSLDYPFGGHQAMHFCDFPYNGSLFGLVI